jgi:carbon monoxide dehydrogenase subunit G
MKIKSNEVEVSASQETVFNLFKDTSNLHFLLPEEEVSEWKSNEDSCSFKVQKGTITISLIQNGYEGLEKIFMKSGEKSPFPFSLTIHIKKDDNKVNGFIEFDGEVNMFLKMMVEKPLTNLFNNMASQLKCHFETT